ncbi:hypothetical protein TWF481_002803 [Arthrobotrys musiformis]|uniref:Uncharacterized protein n=1 Tax=Arthrobotrys musiformis TaxID=47236 RepID=A0AAV9VTQ5_9PEZI
MSCYISSSNQHGGSVPSTLSQCVQGNPSDLSIYPEFDIYDFLFSGISESSMAPANGLLSDTSHLWPPSTCGDSSAAWADYEDWGLNSFLNPSALELDLLDPVFQEIVTTEPAGAPSEPTVSQPDLSFLSPSRTRVSQQSAIEEAHRLLNQAISLEPDNPETPRQSPSANSIAIDSQHPKPLETLVNIQEAPIQSHSLGICSKGSGGTVNLGEISDPEGKYCSKSENSTLESGQVLYVTPEPDRELGLEVRPRSSPCRMPENGEHALVSLEAGRDFSRQNPSLPESHYTKADGNIINGPPSINANDGGRKIAARPPQMSNTVVDLTDGQSSTSELPDIESQASCQKKHRYHNMSESPPSHILRKRKRSSHLALSPQFNEAKVPRLIKRLGRKRKHNSIKARFSRPGGPPQSDLIKQNNLKSNPNRKADIYDEKPDSIIEFDHMISPRPAKNIKRTRRNDPIVDEAVGSTNFKSGLSEYGGMDVNSNSRDDICNEITDSERNLLLQSDEINSSLPANPKRIKRRKYTHSTEASEEDAIADGYDKNRILLHFPQGQVYLNFAISVGGAQLVDISSLGEEEASAKRKPSATLRTGTIVGHH